jgi:hypothetical protein
METLRELDTRRASGLEVTLFWHRGTDRLAISVQDASSSGGLELEVDPAHALDAFRHPYTYAAGPYVSDARPAADPSFADG